ncbi:MAG: SprT-like domain-containing protein [Polyangia bacterium]|nr:SprT-like domain-containing protein [Polyangia bacterium]
MDTLPNIPAREQLTFGFQRGPAPGPRRFRVSPGAPHRARQARFRRAMPPDPRQAALPLAQEIDEVARLRLERRIGAHLRGELRVVVTDNRYSILSVRRGKGSYEARLHHMFLGADPKVVRALARYIARNDDEASAQINDYIDRNHHLIRLSLPGQGRPARLRPEGRYFDLEEIFDELNQTHFQGRIQARITWGRRTAGRAKRHRSVKMGSYSVEEQLIRINPSLDRAFVPRFFVEYVVFHEMLHQVHEIPVINGRRHYHTPGFVAHERSLPTYPAARRWELENLSRLLHY